MPITPPVSISNQITPQGNLPYYQQMNFGAMIGEVLSWNPNADSSMCSIWINNAARKIYDRKLWWGLMTKGQIVTPPYYSAGTITATVGSDTIVGVGTTFNASMVGSSIRVGYNTPIYNIIAVTDATHLTIEMPWGFQTLTNTPYYIVKYYYTIPNIKYIYAAINLQLQYRLLTNLTQGTLDNIDPSRQQIMYPWALAAMPPASDGSYQFELYPASMTQQAIPYLGYVQPPNLRGDQDSLPPTIRCDIVVAHAISDALRYRTKDNPRYSENIAVAIAETKLQEFEGELLMLDRQDENLYRQDVTTPFERFPYYRPGGAVLDAISPVMGGGDLGMDNWGEY